MKTLKDNIEAAAFLWDLLQSLVSSHPIPMFVLLVIAVVVVVEQCRNITQSFLSDFSSGRWVRVTVVAIFALFVAAVAEYSIVRYGRPAVVARLPLVSTSVIGESVTASWEIPSGAKTTSSDQSLHVRYVLEYRLVSDAHSTRVRTWAAYHSFTPSEGAFEWRVMAEREDEGRPGAFEEYAAWSPWRQNSFYRTALNRIRRTKVVMVGVSQDYLRPYIFHDELADRTDGIDIRVVEAVARALSRQLKIDAVQVRYVPNVWLDGNSDDLHSGATDIAIGQTDISAEREAKYRVRFTTAYWRSYMAVVTSRARPLKSLRGARLTAWQHTTYEPVARSLSDRFVESHTIPEMFARLESGGVDGFIDDLDVLTSSIGEPGRSQFTLRRLTDAEVPASIKRTLTYPLPEGIYVDEREAELLAGLLQCLADPQTRQELEGIRQYFRRN